MNTLVKNMRKKVTEQLVEIMEQPKEADFGSNAITTIDTNEKVSELQTVMVDTEKMLEDLPGIGPKTVEKLKEAGYDDLMALATASAADVAAIAEIGEPTAAKIIAAARSSLHMGFDTGLTALERRKSISKVTTGSKSLDVLLGGGIETGAITEAYGAFGSGKSQLAHQLAVNSQLPKNLGGLDGCVLWVDTESTFRPERIIQLAEAKGMNAEEVLKKIFVARAYNSDHQILLIDKAKDIMKEKNIKLVIVDSITTHFRSDFVGRGNLANRQQKMNQHVHTLQRLADTFNAAVYIANQVMANPGMLFGDPTTAVGGHILHHASTYRIYLRKSKGDLRVAKMIDAPSLPDGETLFRVTSKGIEDKDAD